MLFFKKKKKRGTIVARILYYTLYERYFFPLSKDVVIKKFR